MKKVKVKMSFSEMSLERLGTYVMDIQHLVLKDAVPTLFICSKVMEEINPTLSKLLEELGQITNQHLDFDEKVFFPYLKSEIKGWHDVTLDSPMQVLENIKAEHEQINHLLNQIREISDEYTPPALAAPSLKLHYARLFDFEQDMLKHIFLEEDLLFPKLFEQNK